MSNLICLFFSILTESFLFNISDNDIFKFFYFNFRYAGWKGLFPREMLSDPMVKSNFNRALTLMDHAAHGTLVPGMKENMAYFITSERYAVAFPVIFFTVLL